MLLVIILCTASVAAISLLWIRLKLDSGPKIIHTSLSNIKATLSPANASGVELLKSRARPNQRLRRAFGLTNTFVSEDSTVHSTFRGKAASLIWSPSSDRWLSLQDGAVKATLHFYHDSSNVQSFGEFVQTVSLGVIATRLLDKEGDVTMLDPEDVLLVAKSINELWCRSKSPDPIPTEILVDLNTRLRRFVPNTESYPNPLDFVIPSWETMWRVVALALARSYSEQKFRSAFAMFHRNPTKEQFCAFGEDGEPSAEAIITETLRLYPPTKHISRVIQPSPRQPLYIPSSLSLILEKLHIQRPRHEVADIAAVQTSAVWGLTKHEFNPGRHHPSRTRKDQEETLLAFGYGRFSCVAAKWAPLAAAVIVAAILDFLDKEDVEIIPGARVGGREGWDGWHLQRNR